MTPPIGGVRVQFLKCPAPIRRQFLKRNAGNRRRRQRLRVADIFQMPLHFLERGAVNDERLAGKRRLRDNSGGPGDGLVDLRRTYQLSNACDELVDIGSAQLRARDKQHHNDCQEAGQGTHSRASCIASKSRSGAQAVIEYTKTGLGCNTRGSSPGGDNASVSSTWDNPPARRSPFCLVFVRVIEWANRVGQTCVSGTFALKRLRP
jgi:hypothetical protein